MSDWRRRKNERVDHFWLFVFGWKLRECAACAGSGYYDNAGSPPCAACNGTGNERYKSATWERGFGPLIEDVLRQRKLGLR